MTKASDQHVILGKPFCFPYLGGGVFIHSQQQLVFFLVFTGCKAFHS
uniref:Uncharacterized protein n=1 Tax=Anguilla anguilla TaxID=7936 RepID=A0A0E9VRF1_ANGAN